jgi:multidrug efflux pump subunit AcrA (membrane-fusion protein)
MSSTRAQGGSRGDDRVASVSDLLTPGMSAQIEVITGRRSVLSYLLSPISRATNEAGRER